LYFTKDKNDEQKQKEKERKISRLKEKEESYLFSRRGEGHVGVSGLLFRICITRESEKQQNKKKK